MPGDVGFLGVDFIGELCTLTVTLGSLPDPTKDEIFIFIQDSLLTLNLPKKEKVTCKDLT